MKKVYERLGKNAKAMIGCQLLNAIIDIFLNTFFIAHMLNITNDNLGVVSKFYILLYVVVAISMFLMGKILKKVNNSKMFRIGIIIKFLVVVGLVFLKDNLKDYLILIAPALGLADAVYWAPCDNIIKYIVTDDNRMKYYTFYSIFKNTLSVVVPIILGTFIDVMSFDRVTIYILLLTIVQIIISFWINVDSKQNDSFKLLPYIKEIKNNPNKDRLLSFYKIALMFGILFNLIPTLITILVVKVFNTNFKLGLFQTLFAFTAMIAVLILKKKYNNNRVNDILLIGGMLSLLSVFILFYNIGANEIIFYHFINTTFLATIDTLFANERHNDEKNGVEEKFNTENQMLINIFIQIGRIAGFVLLYLSSFVESNLYFRIVLLIATTCIPMTCFLFGKMNKRPEVQILNQEKIA